MPHIFLSMQDGSAKNEIIQMSDIYCTRVKSYAFPQSYYFYVGGPLIVTQDRVDPAIYFYQTTVIVTHYNDHGNMSEANKSKCTWRTVATANVVHVAN